MLADDALVTDLPLVFSEDFDAGHDRWELTDDKAWTLREVEGDNVFGLNKRTSDYTPKIRSPHNIALVKDLELSDFIITFKVKSTNDTGNHRDCCVFFLPHRSNSLLLLPSRSKTGFSQRAGHDRKRCSTIGFDEERESDTVEKRNMARGQAGTELNHWKYQGLLRGHEDALHGSS